MIREMELRQFKPRTVESYVGAIVGLANFYHRSPEQLQLEEVRSYLHHLLRERKLSRGTCNLRCALPVPGDRPAKRDRWIGMMTEGCGTLGRVGTTFPG